MTTTILDAHKLEKLFAHVDPRQGGEKPVKGLSGQELVDRIRELFTPQEAADLARRIEAGRAERHD